MLDFLGSVKLRIGKLLRLEMLVEYGKPADLPCFWHEKQPMGSGSVLG